MSFNQRNPIGLLCVNNDEFWETVINEFFGTLELLSRIDIPRVNLKQHAIKLNGNVRTHYTLVINSDDNVLEVIDFRKGIVPIEQYPPLESTRNYLTFNIRGLEPTQGNIGYLVSFLYDDPPTYNPPQEQYRTNEGDMDFIQKRQYFVAPITEVEDIFYVAMTWLADQMRSTLMKEVPDGQLSLAGPGAGPASTFQTYPTVDEITTILTANHTNWVGRSLKTFDSAHPSTYLPLYVFHNALPGEDYQTKKLLGVFVQISQLFF